MAVRQYVGARYVPIFMGDYDPEFIYEPLSIVTYNLNSYTSKKAVPAGIVPTNTEYWALTGNYSGAVSNLENRMSELEDGVEALGERYPRRAYFRPEDYGAIVNDPDTDCSLAIKAAILAAQEAGGIVLLSAGVYHCVVPIVIPNHLQCVRIIGTGSSNNGSTEDVRGTCLLYEGTGTFIHFGGGLWNCELRDFDLVSTVNGTTLMRLSRDLSGDFARTTRTKFSNLLFQYTGIGLHCSNAAYLDIDECFFRSEETFVGMNKTGLLFDDHNEYVNITRTRITVHLISDLDGVVYNSAAIKIIEGTHFYFYNLDMTHADIGIYLPLTSDTGTVAFVDVIDCDMAYVHYGVWVTLDSVSLQMLNTRQLVITAEDSFDPRNRAFKIDKIAGGSAYSARMQCLDTWIRLGDQAMTYWVEATGTSLFPGACKFTFNGSQVPKVNYGPQTEIGYDHSNFGTSGAITGNLDDYKYSGFAPVRFKADSTSSPGFECMVLCYASAVTTIQIALPISHNQSIAFRIYYKSGDSWSAWQTLAKST